MRLLIEKKCPTEILHDVDKNLCHWLCCLVSEIRKDNGEEYTIKEYDANTVWFATFYQLETPVNQVKLCDKHSEPQLFIACSKLTTSLIHCHLNHFHHQ